MPGQRFVAIAPERGQIATREISAGTAGRGDGSRSCSASIVVRQIGPAPVTPLTCSIGRPSGSPTQTPTV